jgi:signal transduction histidine kinase
VKEPSAAHVDRSVFRRLSIITTALAVAELVVITLFFALTVHPHFESAELNRQLRAAHFALIGPVLLLIVAMVVVAHLRLRKLLLPLRSLAEGVNRLTRGDLDVVIAGSSRDEFATLTDAFNQMVKRVREMIAARDQLLRDVSHELRSPITRIKVALELLPESEPRARLGADVRELEAMVTELLEMERLRSGSEIRKEPIDLVLLASNVIASFGETTPPIVLRAERDVLVVQVDSRMMSVVLRNLIENAAAHSLPDSGAVEVTIDQSAAGARVCVIDDGPGIPESEMDNIFEAFYRIDRSRSRRTGGYGLGLSICKRVVTAHGGTIAVRRRDGRGTIFEIVLP